MIEDLPSAELDRLIQLVPRYDPNHNSDGYHFDYEKANDALCFIQTVCKHVEGPKAGQPFILEDWQRAIIANLFGWRRDDNGARRYEKMLLYIPRKNGKTALCAAILLYVTFCDEEIGQQNYGVAADTEQAGYLFRAAAGMVNQDAFFSSRSTVYEPTKRIVVPVSNSFFKILSREHRTKHGGNTYLGICDELHVTPRDLVSTIETSQDGRPAGLIIFMTTSDHERPSRCNEEHAYAKRIRDREVDNPNYLPVIYEAELAVPDIIPTVEDLHDWGWKDERVWAIANPNYGVSIDKRRFTNAMQEAMDRPEKENEEKRLKLNIKTEQAFRWIQMERWNQCVGDVDLDDLKEMRCYAGLDISDTQDMTALVLFFPDVENFLLPFFWCPRNSAVRRNGSDIPYLTWEKQGHMVVTDGDTIDHAQIEAVLEECSELYDIKVIEYDPWNAREFATRMYNDGGYPMEKFPQTMKYYNEPCRKFSDMLVDKELSHGGHPVLKWMAGNISIQKDTKDNMMPDKKSSGEKIDGIVAAIMAIGGWIDDGGEYDNAYEDGGVMMGSFR